MELLKKTSLILSVGVILLLALLMGGLRLAVSNIEYFKSEIAYLLERDVSEGIVFSRVSGSMNRFNPILRIENVSINLPDRSQPLFIDQLEVEFDFWASLRERVPVALKVGGTLEKVELTRDPSGQWWLNEYALAAGNTALPGFSQLLAFLPRYLKLDLRRLIIRDQKNESVHQLSRVAARIIHRKGQFFTQVSAALPEEFGTGLLLKSVVDSDSSLIYVDGSDLRLSPLARLFGVDTRGFKSGSLDGEVWVNMTGFDVTGISGDLDLKQGVFQVAIEKPRLAIDYHGRLHVDTSTPGWRISNRVERLTIDGKTVPGFHAQVGLPGGASSDRLSAWISRMTLSSLPVVAGQWLPNALSQQIAQGRLQGELQDMVFEMDFDQPELFRFGARVVDLGSKHFKHFPGVSNLNADFVMGNNKLAATVHGEGISLDFGNQFRAPLQIDALKMEAILNRQASGNLLISVNDIQLHNQDIKGIGRLRLETDGDNAPFIFLRVAFSDAMVSSVSKYIPIRLMPAKTIKWLDRAIIDGFVPSGDLQYHGRLRDLRRMANERSGEFFVDFAVENADLDFAPGWLHAKPKRGRVQFHNAGVEFEIEQGSYERIDGLSAQGAITDFYRASLELAITTEASTADALRVFSNTPVGERYRDVLARLEDLDGSVGAAIDIRLPLGKDVGGRSVKVQVDFKDAATRVPEWGLELTQITGRLQFNDNKITANNIGARFFGDPIRIDIAGQNPAVNTRVSVLGNIESANLLRRLPKYLGASLTGSSDWQVQLNIAGDAIPSDRPMLRVNATSDLRQTRIDLPQPFRKQASAALRMTTEVDFYPQQVRFASNLGDEILLRGAVREERDREFVLDALEIAFASDLAARQQKGVNLYGSIAQLSVDDWLEVLQTAGETDEHLLQSVDLWVDRVEAFKRTHDSVDFKLRQEDGRFQGTVDASSARGSFEFPLEPTERDPLRFNLAYLNIENPDQQDDFSQLEPSDLPPLILSSKSLRFHDMLFNDLLIEGHLRGDTFEVTKFNMRRDALQVQGDALWEFNPSTSGHLSSANLTIRGEGLGEAINELGFGNSMSQGTIDFSGEFTWPAALPAVSLENLQGDAQLKITDGVLNNVEPGSGGRFVGLLSLSALPRRLSLDFSDVLIGGMEFDEVSGKYRIADGVLHTRNTRMEGPAAKIKISGKTGIIDRDYDQRIRVIPNIRHTLPILGVVAVGTTVGWGLLLLQNVFKKAIDDAVEIEYRVTGSWDDPNVELIKAVDENQQELPNMEK